MSTILVPTTPVAPLASALPPTLSAAQESALAAPALSAVLQNSLLALGLATGLLAILILGCWLKLRKEAASAARYAQLFDENQDAEAQKEAAQRRQSYYRACLVVSLALLVFCVLYACILVHYERRFMAWYTEERARAQLAEAAQAHPAARGKRSESACEPIWSVNLGFYCSLFKDVVIDPFYVRKIDSSNMATPIYLGHVTESYLLGLLEHIKDPRFLRHLRNLFCESGRKSVYLNAMATFEAVNRAG